jgi:MFS family permease
MLYSPRIEIITFMQVIFEIKLLFRSLRHKNFRLFWLGQLVSLIGSWMQNMGLAWLVLEITHSSFKLGMVSALQFLPMMFLSFFTGPFIDYLDKRKIIIGTQITFMILAFILAFLDWTGAIQYWEVLILATLLGVVNTIDMPTRQSFIIEMVGKEDLMNAIALNSSIFNAARAIGPAVAGLLIAAVGTASCFFINGLSFMAVLWSLFFIKIPPRQKEPPTYRVLEDIGNAMRYVKNTPVVLTTILLVAVVSIFGINFNVLVPVFAKMELNRDATAFGLLMSSFGTGALTGAITLAILSRYGPQPAFLLGGGTCLSLVLLLLGLQKTYGLTALLLGFAGWSMIVFLGMANTTVQLNTKHYLRGRVMSIYTLTFAELTPIGSLFAGFMASWISAPLTFALGGLICGIVFLIVIGGRSKIEAWGKKADGIS